MSMLWLSVKRLNAGIPSGTHCHKKFHEDAVMNAIFHMMRLI